MSQLSEMAIVRPLSPESLDDVSVLHRAIDDFAMPPVAKIQHFNSNELGVRLIDGHMIEAVASPELRRITNHESLRRIAFEGTFEGTSEEEISLDVSAVAYYVGKISTRVVLLLNDSNDMLNKEGAKYLNNVRSYRSSRTRGQLNIQAHLGISKISQAYATPKLLDMLNQAKPQSLSLLPVTTSTRPLVVQGLRQRANFPEDSVPVPVMTEPRLHITNADIRTIIPGPKLPGGLIPKKNN